MDTTCGIYLINKNNQILLVHPINAPKFIWSIPKGLMDKGETYLETALRETFEETNIKIDMHSSTIKRIMEFEMVKYRKTKKQLKSYALIVNDDFSGITLKCTSTFKNRDGINVPENDLVQWYPLEFKSDPQYSHIQLHESQETILELLVKKLTD
jgi:ADP-ribose pyrophosphatase YjhB (NUDIX family)